MTISSEVRKAGPFSGNDVTTAFSFSFKVFSTADVLAVSADSLGLETVLTKGVAYTVSLNANQNANPGGTVTLTSPLATGYTLVLTSQVQNLQPTDLTNQGGFYPAVINAALDRATIQIQQLSEKVNRSAKLPITRTEDVDALLRDIVVLADNLSSVNTVAGSVGSVNTVAGVSADVSTVAGNIANINAAVADLPALSAKVSKTGDTMTGNLNVPSINGGQLAGMRNKIINGAFAVNQRGYGSGVATTAGQYTFDRWKVTGTGGITFSTTANKTTVTIPSGQTLQQVIEGLNLQTGTYVLSWEGTAQGRIAGGSYGASGAVTASITGGTNTTIEFNSGTVANVQLEPGTVATPFEWRLNELQLCERYCFQRSGVGFYFTGQVRNSTSVFALVVFPVEMFSNPTLTVNAPIVTDSALGIITSSGGVIGNLSKRSVTVDCTVAGGLVAGNASLIGGNTAASYFRFNAEL